MLKFSVELKNPTNGMSRQLTVDSDTALEAINQAKAWNPDYSELVTCEVIKRNC